MSWSLLPVRIVSVDRNLFLGFSRVYTHGQKFSVFSLTSDSLEVPA